MDTEARKKAIEQYKSILRQDPDSSEARDALKRLYKQTQGYNALVELLRQQLERLRRWSGKLKSVQGLRPINATCVIPGTRWVTETGSGK